MTLDLRGVSVDYGDQRAVSDVDLTIAADAGPTTAILGPSGCGKSTLLRAIAGLEPLATGTVSFDGVDLTGVPPHRRDFGMVFQDAQLFPGRTVAANIAYGLRARRWPRAEIAQRVSDMLELVRLPGLADRRVDDLSGGQAQRVALARALAPRPRLLLLDEPLAALDAHLREQLADDIVDIVTAAATPTIVVTHDHDEAATMGDTVVVMRAGAVVVSDTATRVWRYPHDEWTARFLGWEHLLPAEHVGELVRTELGDLPAADLGVPPGATISAIAVRAESLRAESLRAESLRVESVAPAHRHATALPVLRVRDLPGRSQVILDGSSLATAVPELGAHVDEIGARPRVGDVMTVRLVAARVGILADGDQAGR